MVIKPLNCDCGERVNTIKIADLVFFSAVNTNFGFLTIEFVPHSHSSCGGVAVLKRKEGGEKVRQRNWVIKPLNSDCGERVNAIKKRCIDV